MNADTLDKARALIERHEGRRVWVYLDSVQIPTVGVGFNLNRSDARAMLTQVGADYDRVRRGETPLTDEQVDKLLDECIEECAEDLGLLFANFDAMPELAQLVLLDLRFNLGPRILRQFKLTLDAFKRGAWGEAAANLEPTKWAKQVGKRATEDLAMLRRIDE